MMAEVTSCLLPGRTDHLETRALPEGPGSVGGPMKCPWYLFHRTQRAPDRGAARSQGARTIRGQGGRL
ncbi:unnamed protein product [Staurois parvus]|uniref:Uncharacterized protein n=1 Tax=Staurois parvus TaxID=386267 RepID=A0ABN9FXM0_9NEOB|nr:unnamed protein product [Staurois parvus]